MGYLSIISDDILKNYCFCNEFEGPICLELPVCLSWPDRNSIGYSNGEATLQKMKLSPYL